MTLATIFILGAVCGAAAVLIFILVTAGGLD